ncbi:tRNA (guanine(9)-N(1))-methyltransferase [Coniosporium apollinis]|uniref:tRNA (guanine(9)-N1)-methyltransferase n=1 Tax=Coniosporium apollinis TaxID=61459 RepID=A0ABQ9NLZ6_9PEZI|nr:tRNA (guanine(9)-N(1))-methyltransferase [Coniosporium apollinis]
MEAEERPTKLQKLHHDSESEQATFAPPEQPANGIHKDEMDEQPAPQPRQAAEEPAIPSASDTKLPNPDHEPPKLSKNQAKKLRRQQEWDAGRDARKAKRKEQIKAKKERKRAAIASDAANGTSTASTKYKIKGQYHHAQQLPITFVFDCDFDDLMYDKELKSLASQLTRSYSDNKNARLRAHLAVASFGGRLKERFETVLARHHESWKRVRWFEEDFAEVAERAKEWMRGPGGGKLAGALVGRAGEQRAPTAADAEEKSGDVVNGEKLEDVLTALGTESDPEADPEADSNARKVENEGEIIYLSSESENTLTELKPYSTYIIGGLVDHNRHKGICYRRATDKGIKTAKLPIGELLQMDSRKVLATNHVCEIMLQWLELGNWGEAFMKVIPKRKKGALKGNKDTSTEKETEAVDESNGDVQEMSDEGCQSDRDEDSDDGGVTLAAEKEPEVADADMG